MSDLKNDQADEESDAPDALGPEELGTVSGGALGSDAVREEPAGDVRANPDVRRR